MSTAEIAIAATPGLPMLRTCLAMASAAPVMSKALRPVTTSASISVMTVWRRGRGVAPAEPLLTSSPRLHQHHRGLVPGQRAVGFGCVSGYHVHGGIKRRHCGSVHSILQVKAADYLPRHPQTAGGQAAWKILPVHRCKRWPGESDSRCRQPSGRGTSHDTSSDPWRTRDDRDRERHELAVGRRLPGRGSGSVLPHLLGRPGGRQIARAKKICAGCGVRRECLEFALSHGQVYGIWGGTTPEDRQRERRRKRRAAGGTAAHHRGLTRRHRPLACPQPCPHPVSGAAAAVSRPARG